MIDEIHKLLDNDRQQVAWASQAYLVSVKIAIISFLLELRR